MHLALHKLEVWVDRITAPLLAAFLILIIGEFFFSQQFEFYNTYADWFDGVVVAVLAVDLWFKYERVRKLRAFLKKYWLQIIAALPFFLAFRLLEFISLISEGSSALVQMGKETALLIKETSKAVEVSRTVRIINTFKVIGRFPRMVAALPFFEKPTGKHHPHEKRSITRQ